MSRLLPALPVFPTRFQPVYVGDVADAIARILEDADTAGKTYELGGPRVYTFRELMEIVLQATQRKRALIPLPLAIAHIQGFFLQWLPVPPLTTDQVKLLGRDNIVGPNALTLKDLGIEATAVEAVVPAYLSRFRPVASQARRAG
jgi:NADH dehydrogenase